MLARVSKVCVDKGEYGCVLPRVSVGVCWQE